LNKEAPWLHVATRTHRWALLAAAEPKAKRPPNAQAVMFTEATVLAQELRKEQPNAKWAQHVKAGYAAVKKRQLEVVQ